IHIVWGGLGMALLLRSQGLSLWASLFGALTFEALPKLIAHFGAGHLTILYALPWFPWLLWLSARPRSSQVSTRFLLGPGCVLALIFLADPRMAALASLFWLIWVLMHLPEKGTSFQVKGSSGTRLPRLAFTTLWVLFELLIAFLLSSALALPLLELIGLSPRGSMGGEGILAFTLPPSRLLGLVYPDFGGNHELILYAGSPVLILAVLAVLWRHSTNSVRFWLVVLLMSLAIAAAGNLSLSDLAGRLPGINLLRVPSRALFLTGISLAALAANGADQLIATIADRQARFGRLVLAGFLFLGIA
ncbi:MAG TPA: hypothetical protein VJ768_03220, partial [Anaerolineales bacterium]|nr:hypothetical protein [Anaerolineales bacterium]